ncbi:ComEC/Rec2 family competence protein [Akkermansiaceae bacterium]|nr:ComEC/Rec2 family competence protein [Akkermansiaceae bacterium]
MLTRLWVRRPLFLLAAGVVAMLWLGTVSPWLGWAGCVLLAVLLWPVADWKTALGAMLLAAFFFAQLLWRDARRSADEVALGGLGYAHAEARLTEDAVAGERGWSGTARLRGGDFHGRKIRWSGSGEAPPAGTELSAVGVFAPLEAERNPGVPDSSRRLRDEGVCAVFRADAMRSRQWLGPVSARAAMFKRSFRKGIVAGLEEDGLPAKVICAVVLGERSKDSLGLVRDFRESGTLHVFTVSGMHVMMLGSMVWFALKWAGAPRRAAIPAIILAMFGYAWLTGNGPAAVRAAWMGAVFLGAFALRRRTDLLNALGVVLLVSLFFDPRMIRMPGVQLSYGVVAAIGIGTAAARRCFAWIAEEEELLPASELGFLARKWLGFRRKLAEALAVSTAASVGSTPLSAFHFGLFTPVSVIATVALVPTVYALLGIALVSSMVHPFWEKGSVFLNRGNARVAQVCAGTARFFAGLPGASASIRSADVDTLVIHDLGYGASAACFASAAGNAVLIDAGGKFSLEREVGPSLMGLGMEPDSAILTHTDAGHVVAPGLMLEMFPLRQVASGMTPARGSVADKWAGFGGIGFRVPGRGDLLDFGGGAWAEVLVSPGDGLEGSLADDRGLVFRLHWRDRKFLFTGDAGRRTEEWLLDSGADLQADVIVAGLHESDLSLTKPFIAAVKPQAIIVPRPAGCAMDRHRAFQKSAWSKAGIRVIGQTETGGITVTIRQDGGILLEGFLDGSETLIRKR